MNNEDEKKFTMIRRKGKTTRYYVDNELVERADELGLKPNDISVYNALARHANSRDQTCYPSRATLMKKSGVRNKNTLSGCLKRLERLSLIEIIHSTGHHPNTYKLLDPMCWSANGTTNATDVNNQKPLYQNEHSNSTSRTTNSTNIDTLTHTSNSNNLNHKQINKMKKRLADKFSTG